LVHTNEIASYPAPFLFKFLTVPRLFYQKFRGKANHLYIPLFLSFERPTVDRDLKDKKMSEPGFFGLKDDQD
jgi:hypothetical protein